MHFKNSLGYLIEKVSTGTHNKLNKKFAPDKYHYRVNTKNDKTNH